MSGRHDSDTLEKWPEWALNIRRSYLSGAASVFLLHGVRDSISFRGRFVPLSDFLNYAFCGDKTTVYYDVARGISFPSPEDEKEFRRFVDVYSRRSGVAVDLRESYRPEIAIPLLESFLTTRDGAGVIIDYVEKLAPREEERFMSFSQRRLVTTLQRWGSDPRLVRRNNFVFMIAEALTEVHEDLYNGTGGTKVVSLPLPDYDERLEFINFAVESEDLGGDCHLDISREALATNTDGLTRVQIGRLIQRAVGDGETLSLRHTSEYKREVIQSEIGDLVAFMQPELGLDAVAGVERQKRLLVQTAEALREGRKDIVPKGILLVGPPGCGKTFTMECFAHDAGIPFVQLRNIFSKYVGSTESNLERVFHYLNALAPVFVFIDEFDQSYGRRVTSDTDSGVTRRVFGMFNSFLADESHQGRILFGAATNRPDLIDPSTMRAGRFDMKLPFLLPGEEARSAILHVSMKTLGIEHEGLDLAGIPEKTQGYSGADLKELCKVAQRQAAFDGRREVGLQDLEFAVEDYITPTASRRDEIRYMELLAVTACTSRSLLPEQYLSAIDSGTIFEDLRELETLVR
ncbi:MAG: ATP-binding protein [Armatimonadota bacterium]